MSSQDPLAPPPIVRDPAPAPVAPPRRRWPVAVAVVVAVALVVGGALAGTLLSRAVASNAAPPGTTPTPSASALPTPEPTGTEPPSAAGLPADCSVLLEDVLDDGAWSVEYERLPETAGGEGLFTDGGRFVAADFAFDFLAQSMTMSERLTCATTTDGGASTLTSWVTRYGAPRGEDLAQSLDRYPDAYVCSDHRDGRLCEITYSGEGSDLREQHFMRDGLWIATLQSAAWSGPPFDDGYLDALIDAAYDEEG